MRARSKQDYRTKSDFEIKHSLFDLKKVISLALATFGLCLGIYLIIPTVVGFAGYHSAQPTVSERYSNAIDKHGKINNYFAYGMDKLGDWGNWARGSINSAIDQINPKGQSVETDRVKKMLDKDTLSDSDKKDLADFYAKEVNIDSNKYDSYKNLASAVYKALLKKNKQTYKQNKSDQNQLSKTKQAAEDHEKAWDKYENYVNTSYKLLTKSQQAKVDEYIKKHGNPDKGSDKYYSTKEKAIYEIAPANSKAGKYFRAHNSSIRKETKKINDREGVTAKDVEKQLQSGKQQEPTSLAGKIAQAIFNFFWSTSVGEWLEKNTIGATIFGGAITSSQLNDIVYNKPYLLMYPVNTVSQNMYAVSNWMEPNSMQLALLLLIIILMIAGIRFAWGIIMNNAQSRSQFWHNIIDTVMSSVGLVAYPAIVTTLLQLNGVILLYLQGFMQSIQVQGNNVFTEAIHLGFGNSTLKALTSGGILGVNFSGAFFSLIYLFTAVGLAVYIKYYYFIRAIAFTILISVGPIFIAFWASDLGKRRAWNWLHEMVSTIFIQSVQALTICYLAMFSSWNNSRIALQTATAIAHQENYNLAHPVTTFANNILSNSGLLGGIVAAGFRKVFNVQTPSVGAGNFEVLVVGWIIMISFLPISRGLAELFGLQTHLLDGIHQSTSNALKTAALVGGSALALAAIGPTASILGKAGLDTLGNAGTYKALGEGLKAAKNTKGLKNRVKAMKKAYKNSANNPHAFSAKHLNDIVQKWNGKVGEQGAQAIAAAGALGADAPEAVGKILQAKAGGKIGEKAAALAGRAFAKLGLNKQKYGNTALAKQQAEAIKEAQTKGREQDLKKMLNDAASGDADIAAQSYAKKTGESVNSPNAQKMKQWANHWNSMTDKEKDAYVASAIHGTNGDYSKVKDLQSKINDSLARLSGTTYDGRHGKPQNEAELDAKAKAMGLSNTYKEWKQDMAHSGNEVSVSDANAFLNRTGQKAIFAAQEAADIAGATSPNDQVIPYDPQKINEQVKQQAEDYSKTSRMQQLSKNDPEKYKQHMDSFKEHTRQQLMNAGNNEQVLSAMDSKQNFNQTWGDLADPKTGNESFKNSWVDKSRFSNALESRLKSIGVDSSAIAGIKSQVGSVQAKPLFNNISIDPQTGLSTPTINQNMYHELAEQAALNQQSLFGGEPAAKDYENIRNTDYSRYSPDPSKVATSSDVQSYFDRQRKAYDRMNYETRAAHNEAVARTAAQSESIFNVDNWFDSSRSSGMSGGLGRLSAGASTAFGRANQRVASYNQKLAQPIGISIAQARRIANESIDSDNGEGRIAPGQFRVAINNGLSRMEVKDPNGNYQMVGDFGIGDSTLTSGQTVYQNLAFDDNGGVVPELDPVTHRPAMSYQIIGNERVPYALPSGGPDLSSMIAPVGSTQRSLPRESAVRSSGYYGIPYSKFTNPTDSKIPTQEQISSSNDYGNYYLDFDRNGSVITGESNSDNQTQVLSSRHSESFLHGMPEGARVQIPIKMEVKGNGFYYDTSRGINYLDGSLDVDKQRSLRQEVRELLDSGSRRGEMFDVINHDMLSVTPKSYTNELSNNRANTDIKGLNTFDARKI